MTTENKSHELRRFHSEIRKQEQDLTKFYSRYFGNINQVIVQNQIQDHSLPPSSGTRRVMKRVMGAVLRYFVAEQGAARKEIRKDNQIVESPGPAYIASRVMLVNEMRDNSLKYVIKFINDHNLTIDNQNEVNALNTKFRDNKDTKPILRKIIGFDVAGLKQIDMAGMGDLTLLEIAHECLNIADEINQNPEAGALVRTIRYGGDEFIFSIEGGDSTKVSNAVDLLKKLINKKICSIKTRYYRGTHDGQEIVREGNVKIKNNETFDLSIPENEDEKRLLIRHLLLLEINIIPENEHIDSEIENFNSRSESTDEAKFEGYVREKLIKIIKYESTKKNYIDPSEVSTQELEDQAKILTDKFPGLNYLIRAAKYADKRYVRDLEEFFSKLNKGDASVYPETIKQYQHDLADKNVNLRDTIQFLQQYLYDPVVGELMYGSTAFNLMSRADNILGDILIVKQVIKPINDNFGLSNGDAVIQKCFKFLKRTIADFEKSVGVDLLKYLVLGRAQADFMFGVNLEALNKITDEVEKAEITSHLNNLFANLQELKSFDVTIRTKYGELDFVMELGVGLSYYNADGTNISKCYENAETEYNINRILCDMLSLEDTSFLIRSLLGDKSQEKNLAIQNPNIWNLYKYINDPKRGLINTNALLQRFENIKVMLGNANQSQLTKLNSLEKVLKLINTKQEYKENISMYKEMGSDFKNESDSITLNETTQLDIIKNRLEALYLLQAKNANQIEEIKMSLGNV